MTLGKVLVVDDEYFIRSAIQLYLESEGFSVTTASSGDEALERLEEQNFDVSILDIRMPGISGLDVLRRIREQRLPVEVVFATGCGTVATAREAVRLGAFDYIEKPITEFESTLLKVTKRAVEKKRLVVANRRLSAELRYVRTESRRLSAERQAISADLKALDELSLLLDGAGDTLTLLAVAADALERSFDIPQGNFFCDPGDGKPELKWRFGQEHEPPFLEWPDPDGTGLERLRGGDALVDSDLPEELEGFALTAPRAAVPLLAGRVLVGVLLLGGLSKRYDLETQLRVLGQLGRRLGASLTRPQRDLVAAE